MAWNEVIDEFTILTLAEEDFPAVPPEAARFTFTTQVDRDVEREMLQSEFSAWERPYHRRMPGSRDDSLLAMFDGDRLVCIGYMCTENEFGMPGLGQMHYAVMRPEYAGQGLYSIYFARIMRHAAEMGISGVVLTTDRAGLDKVYERWGARFVRKAGKPEPEGQAAAGSRFSARRAKARLRRLLKR